MILNKRILRDFKDNFIRNTAMILIIAMSMSLIISLCAASDSICAVIFSQWRSCNVEDGSFETHSRLSSRNMKDLGELNAEVEKMFFYDVTSKEGFSLRLFENRKSIDLPYTESGRLPQYKNEIFLDKNFAVLHGIICGDTLSVGGTALTVCGTGCLPDYGCVRRNTSDVAGDDEFTVATVTADTWDGLKGTNEVTYNYAFTLGAACSVRDFKDKLSHLKPTAENGGTVVSSFTEAKYNIRINDAVDDSKIGKQSALVVGVFLLILLVYMLSVFSCETIEKERPVIGTLYALGYTKSEILSHYIKMPMLVSALGALLGLIGGYFLTDIMAASYVQMYSFPKLQKVFRAYLLAYSLGIPVVFSFAVNRVQLSKKLSASPLGMMHSHPSATGIFNLRLDGADFCTKYKARQFLREFKGNITLFFGVIMSIILIMFSLACYSSIDGYIKSVGDDVLCNYTYILKGPVTNLPKSPQVGYTRSFMVDYALTNSQMEVSVCGIAPDNPYFPFASTLGDDADRIYMSDSVRIKFGYEIGDRVILCDNADDRLYAFDICGEVKYGSGLYFFMDIDAMRNAFGLDYFDPADLKKGEKVPKTESRFYNTVFSDKKLSFKHNMTEAEISRDDMVKGASKFMTLMWGMIIMMIAVSIIIFVAAMYLLMKLQIDRNSFSISLLRALGYDEKTVRAFYVDNSLIVTLSALVIGIPLCRSIVFFAYPFCVSNVNGGFEAVLTPVQYVIIVLTVMASYVCTRTFLVRRLNKIELTEILKNRE